MTARTRRSIAGGLAALVAVLVSASSVRTQSGTRKDGEWPFYGGDRGYTKYSPLDQINQSNVAKLVIAWQRPAVADELRSQYPDIRFGNNFRSTPIMVGGVLYASNGIGLVEAFDPGTGRTIWVQDLPPGAPLGGTSSRGVAHWKSGDDERILAVRGQYLWALHARTGKLVQGFGDNGRVDLKANLGLRAQGYGWSSGPTICRDVVILGQSMTDSPANKEEPPGDIQAFDVRTGKLRWVFHVIPSPGEVGNETWEADSWSYSGEANVWSMISADEELGLAYLPTGAPTNDMYGGHRLGNNLFGNTLICLRCATGQRAWHFQMVHHDLWDYDNNVAPVLVDIRVNGKPIKAVVQLTKQAMAYVFDRATGQPVWPIVERPVQSSNTPGERTSATQPIPTRPAPFDRQGVSNDDLVDFTPELHSEAVEIARQFVLGPMFTPPSIRGSGPNDKKGTLQMPGATGGAEWGGAGFDPETGVMYIPSITGALLADVLPGDPAKTNLRYTRGLRELPVGPRGLPLTKPPYGRITAINLNTGNHVWSVPNGDGPRDHPALKGLNLPPLGQPSRDMPLLTRTLLFVAQGDPLMIRTPPGGGDSRKIRAYDKASGRVVWEMELPAGATGAMITYQHKGRQYLLVPVASAKVAPGFVALSLPEGT